MEISKDNELLYHYTDLNGVLGIVKSSEIWLGHMLYLNDEAEYKYGLDKFKKELMVQQEMCTDDILRAFLKTLDSLDSYMLKQQAFVFSLTEEKDLLSQWRGYADNGKGVCIGFDKKSIGNGNNVKLEKCVYDEVEQGKRVKELFKETINIFLKTKEESHYFSRSYLPEILKRHAKAFDDAADYLIDELQNECLILKHPSFVEEKEWRLIIKKSEKMDFLVKDSFLKPIEKHKINIEKTIRTIIVGPAERSDLAQMSMDMFMKNRGYNWIKIEKSTIPFRGK